METITNQSQNNEVLNIWQAIRSRMNERRVTPTSLASRTRDSRTKYSKNDIERGVAGEPVPIDLSFLRDCVLAFGLGSGGRAKHYEETVESLTWDECVRLIKPLPAMPPRQGNFWEYSD